MRSSLARQQKTTVTKVSTKTHAIATSPSVAETSPTRRERVEQQDDHHEDFEPVHKVRCNPSGVCSTVSSRTRGERGSLAVRHPPGCCGRGNWDFLDRGGAGAPRRPRTHRPVFARTGHQRVDCAVKRAGSQRRSGQWGLPRAPRTRVGSREWLLRPTRTRALR